jgi:hypothetical protein
VASLFIANVNRQNGSWMVDQTVAVTFRPKRATLGYDIIPKLVPHMIDVEGAGQI